MNINVKKKILIINNCKNLVIQFNVINLNNELVQKLNHYLDKLIEPVLQKIRGFIPNKLAQLDLSSLILFLIIGVIQTIIEKI